MEVKEFSALLINDRKKIIYVKSDLLWILRKSSKMLWSMKYWDDICAMFRDSWSHRTIQVGRVLKRIFVPTPHSNQIQHEQVAQDDVQ